MPLLLLLKLPPKIPHIDIHTSIQDPDSTYLLASLLRVYMLLGPILNILLLHWYTLPCLRCYIFLMYICWSCLWTFSTMTICPLFMSQKITPRPPYLYVSLMMRIFVNNRSPVSLVHVCEVLVHLFMDNRVNLSWLHH